MRGVRLLGHHVSLSLCLGALFLCPIPSDRDGLCGFSLCPLSLKVPGVALHLGTWRLAVPSMPALFWLAPFASHRKETWPRRVWASRDSDPEYGKKPFPLRQNAGVLRNNNSPLLLDLFIYMYESFACMYICVSCACLVPTEVRIGCHIPWNWNCGWPCGCWEMET